MKIAIDAHWLEEGYGGIQSFLLNFLKEIILVDKTNEYFLFFYSGTERLPSLKVKKILENEDFKRKSSLKNFKRKIKWFFWFNLTLPKNLRRSKIDLFLSPNHFLPIFKGVPKEMVVVHDFAWRVNPQWKGFWYRLYAKLFQKRSLKRADFIIAVSKTTKEDLLKYYFFEGLKDKTKVIYEGAGEEFSKVRNDNELLGIKKIYSLPENFILFVGKIEPRKNPRMILEVFENVKKHFQKEELKMVLIGKAERSGKEILQKIKKNKDILHFEDVPQKDLPHIYRLARLFFLPSFYEGFGLPCLPPETNIITRGGIRTIKEIKIGENVLTHLGRFKKVIKTFRRNYKGKLIEIQPRSLNIPIKLTPEHSILAFKRPSKRWNKGKPMRLWSAQEPSWIPASNIEKGDCVIFPIPREEKTLHLFDLKEFDENIKFNNLYVWYKMGYSSKNGKHLKVKRYIKVNKDLAKLIGIYIAEGSTNSTTFSSIEFSLGSEQSLAKEIKKGIKKVFGVGSLIIKEKNKLKVVVSGRIIAKFFSKLCGIGALNKKIDPLFLYGNKELLRTIVDYIYKGDGSKYENRISFSTSSRQLSNDIKIALLRLNQRIWLNNLKRKERRNEEFSVQFSLSNVKNYTHSNKSWFLENKNFCAFLVRRVKKLSYHGEVYNLEVDKDNSYTTESFCVHNCLEAMKSGLPVVCSNGGAFKEIAKDVALMHQPTNKERFVKDILKILENEVLRKELRNKGKKRAENFSWEKTAREFLKIFETSV